MRLIDADAFEVVVLQDVSNEFAEGVQYAMELLDKAPTIEARPVVRGEWVDLGRNYYTVVSQCSECGAKYDFRSPYCPNCGAEMRTKEESEDAGN